MKTTTLTKKTSFILLSLALVSMMSCQKSLVGPADASTSLNSVSTKTLGYIVVNCANCMVQYGMPDQYKYFNVSGTSPKATFSYVPGYNLVTYVTALGQTQDVTLSVYDKNNNIMYQGTVTQPLTGYWSTKVMITDSTSTTAAATGTTH